MDKIKVAVIFGGCSTEYEVSLQSAYSVITSLSPQTYELILLGITRDGRLFRYTGDIDGIPADTWHINNGHCVPAVISPDRNAHRIIELSDGSWKTSEIDIAFPVMHGKNGEDGSIQGLLALAGIPVAGCKTLASALCMDKHRSHELVHRAGIKTPAAITFDRCPSGDDLLSRTGRLAYPLFVKPVRAGSSFGITKVYEKAGLPHAVKNAFLFDDQVIIEENIDGFEVGCAVLGNHELTIGEVDEIELTEGFFDYTEKYTLKTSQIHMPARIDAQTAAKIKETAAVIYKTLGCSGFARVDMFLTPEKAIVFNEVNTIPGLTSHSRYPHMMKGIGLALPEIMDRLIQLGLEA